MGDDDRPAFGYRLKAWPPEDIVVCEELVATAERDQIGITPLDHGPVWGAKCTNLDGAAVADCFGYEGTLVIRRLADGVDERAERHLEQAVVRALRGMQHPDGLTAFHMAV